MDFANMTMTQKKMLGGAAACLLFAISLFFPWRGNSVPDGYQGMVPDVSIKGWDLMPSGWLWLLMGLAAAAILLMSALDMEIPVPVPPFATAFYLISVPFVVMMAQFFESTSGLKFGFFIALLAAAAGTVLAFMVGREVEG